MAFARAGAGAALLVLAAVAVVLAGAGLREVHVPESGRRIGCAKLVADIADQLGSWVI